MADGAEGPPMEVGMPRRGSRALAGRDSVQTLRWLAPKVCMARDSVPGGVSGAIGLAGHRARRTAGPKDGQRVRPSVSIKQAVFSDAFLRLCTRTRQSAWHGHREGRRAVLLLPRRLAIGSWLLTRSAWAACSGASQLCLVLGPAGSRSRAHQRKRRRGAPLPFFLTPLPLRASSSSLQLVKHTLPRGVQ